MACIFPFFGVLPGLWLLRAAGAASCLPDAIPVAERKPLQGPGGTYGLGMWVNDWAAGHAVAEMMAILIEEKMGYLLELKGPGAGTPDGFFALTGCRNPTNSEDRQCEGVNHTRVHINVEGWTIGYQETWDKIQEAYSALAPRNLGNCGYWGNTGAFLFSSLKDRVYGAAGISLNFYGEYSASWKDLSTYFTSLLAVNTSRLLLCNETNLMDSTEMQSYVDTTGDWAGVTREGSKVFGKCWQKHFWVPPSCRSSISRCFVFFTGGSGWQINEMMQKATIHNMAMAVAVGNSWSNYASLPLDYDALFYSWEPDTTFLRKAPSRVVFPDNDALAWSRGDRSSAGIRISVDTHVSQDLRALAPDVEELLSTYQLTLQEVNYMMLDKMDTVNSTHRDAACRWLKGNRQRWQDWLPDKTKCFRGFGIFDQFAVGFGFVKDRTNPTGIVCQPCPSGYFSEQYQDDKGITFVCTACPPGTSQPLGASVGCDLCPAGGHQPESGSTSCRRCGISTYQDVKGQPACRQCPEGTSTLGQGSIASTECGCTEGSINVANLTPEMGVEDQFECQVCGEGSVCPLHSSVNGLTQGVSLSQAVPEIHDGYVSKLTDPLKIFKCNPPSNCPRGKPGHCAGGLEGDLCTRCSAGQTWNGEECSKCDIGVTIGWCFAAAVALVGILVSYFLVNNPPKARASAPQLFVMAFGLVVHAVQTVAGFGLMAVSWPGSFTNVSSGLQIFILDLSTSSLTCLTGWNNLVRYTVSVMAFPVAVLCLLMGWVLTRSLPKNRYLKPWIFPYTFNTIGMLLPAGFASVCVIALQPMMCYSHPNGLQSVLKFPSTFCGNGEHSVMLVMSVVLLLFFVSGFLGVCMLAAWKLPSWSLAQEHKKMQAFQFLTGKFRLDLWWFCVLLLIRGFGFSLVIVIATDVQRAQVALVTAILMTYQVLQSSFWPWKARSINVVDLSLNALLVLLISQSSQEPSKIEKRFASDMTISIMVLMVFCVLCLLILTMLVFMHDFVMALPWMVDHRPKTLSAALKDCVQKLSQIDQDEICDDLRACNQHDLKALERAIAVISSEVIKDEDWVNFQSRISMSSMSSVRKQLLVGADQCAVETAKMAEGAVAAGDVTNVEGSLEEATNSSTSPSGINVLAGEIVKAVL